MQKTTKKFIVAVLLFSLVTMYGSMPMTKAATLESAKDTISDSDVDAVATHTIEFDMLKDLAVGRTLTATFHADFTLGVQGDVTCPDGNAASISGQVVTCNINDSALASTTVHTLTIANVQNPAVTGFYDVTIAANHATDPEISEMLVYIIDDVSVTAHVDATLTFEIEALANGNDVNGTSTTVSSTATTIPFGDLVVGTPAIIGQTLKVTTNASAGYSVTVQQTQDLTSAAGDTIAPAASAPYAAWSPPAGTLGSPETYGKMGLTSSDNTLTATADPFGANLYRGFDGTNNVEVMYHDGPSDGSTDHAGSAAVAYQVEITSLQQAGDYETTLTYICTPVF